MGIYEVGMGSDKQTVEAPSAGAAAIYYGLNLVDSNNPFMAAVYTEDGHEFTGESYWISIRPDEAHMKMVAEKVKGELADCRVIDK